MRARGAAWILVFGACYEAPAGSGPCSITCTDACPGDLTCKGGFCVGADEECTPEFVSVSAGGGFVCALDSARDLWCWGTNDRHQIDPSPERVIPTARRVGTRKWDMISAGRAHTCGISEGRIFCWGGNDYNQIAGSVLGDIDEPTEVLATGGPASWRYVSAGFSNTCAISSEGQLFCWGDNTTGELGNGTATANESAPVPVRTMVTDWTMVSQSSSAFDQRHTCAISQSMGLFCWGGNAYGQVGDNTFADAKAPVAIALPATPTAVVEAAYSTCAIAGGELYCWGYVGGGAGGDPMVLAPALNFVGVPTKGSNLTGFTKLTAAEELVCGLAGSDVYCWGNSDTGFAFADGTFDTIGPAFTKVASGATDISLGFSETVDPDHRREEFDLEHGCFVTGGEIKCWGDNRFAQLGQGAPTESAVPAPVAGNRTWTAIATGAEHACGLDDAGQLACWGSTRRGALDGNVFGTKAAPCVDPTLCDPGTPQTVGAATDVAVGTDHTCALVGTEVQCWGDDSLAQLGAFSVGPAKNTIPGPWTGLLDAHGQATCGQMTGSLFCWGNNTTPTLLSQLPTTTRLTSFGTVGGGNVGAACGLDGNQSLFCLGDNSRGQYGNGPTAHTCFNNICEPGDCESGCPGDCGQASCSTCGNGQCDNGETASCVDCKGPDAAEINRQYRALASGWDLDNQSATVCGVRMDGIVECWGRNLERLIDNTDEQFILSPRQIKGLASCSAIAVGTQHACALCGTDVLCWGNHRHGAVGSGPQEVDRVFPPRAVAATLDAGESWVDLQAGATYTCGRTSAGRVLCWGGNRHGALGLGASSATLPVTVLTE